MAYFMAKVVRPGLRRVMLALVLMPLWASYLVKAYAWRAILDPAERRARVRAFGWSPGFGMHVGGDRAQLPLAAYMILPIYAGLERLPDSLLEASSDLGGKAGAHVPQRRGPALLIPSIVAGSIFTFSLSLGDYIAVGIVGRHDPDDRQRGGARLRRQQRALRRGARRSCPIIIMLDLPGPGQAHGRLREL